MYVAYSLYSTKLYFFLPLQENSQLETNFRKKKKTVNHYSDQCRYQFTKLKFIGY